MTRALSHGETVTTELFRAYAERAFQARVVFELNPDTRKGVVKITRDGRTVASPWPIQGTIEEVAAGVEMAFGGET
jgi:hypothetical protein